MKDTLRNKTSYVGAGAGLVGFVIYGLLPGSMIGGMLGLTIAGRLMGMPVEPGIVARILVTLSMLMGVLLSGLVFTVAGSTLGWLTGAIMDVVTSKNEEMAAVSGR